MGIFNLITFLIVSDFKKYVPGELSNTSLMAVLIMSSLVFGSIAAGYLDYRYGTAKHENDINLKYSPDLNNKLDKIIEMLEKIVARGVWY